MTKALTLIVYGILMLTIAQFCAARAYDRGFAEGYRDLADRVLQGLREKRQADTDEEEHSSDPT